MNDNPTGLICSLIGLAAIGYLFFTIVRGVWRDGLWFFVTDLFVVTWRWLNDRDDWSVVKQELIRSRAQAVERKRASERQAGERQRDEVRRQTQKAEQKRREDCRASCELLHFRHSQFLKERFPKEEMVEYIAKYMNDDKPVEYVEERGQQLRQLIEQKLDDKTRRVEERLRLEEELKTKGEHIDEEQRRLAGEREAFEAEKRRVEELQRRLQEEEADRLARPVSRDIDPENV